MKLHISRKNTILLAVLLVITVLVLAGTFFMGLFKTHAYGETHRAEYLKIIGEYSPDGGNTWLPMGLDFDYMDLQGYQDVIIKGRFNRSLGISENLFIYVDNLAMSFKVNDYEVAAFGQEGAFAEFSNAPGKTYISVNYAHIITDLDRLELTLHNYYKGARTQAIVRNLPKMFLAGDSDTLIDKLMHGGWLLTFLGALLMVSGVYILSSMFMLLNKKLDLKQNIHEIIVRGTFGFFAISAGYFVIMNQLSDVLPLLINRPELCNLLSSLADYGIVFALSVDYMGFVLSRKLQSALWAITGAECVFILVACILQALGIFDLLEMRPIIFLFGIVTSIIAIGDMIYNTWKEKNTDSRNMLLILFLFLVTASMDIVNLYVIPFAGGKMFSGYGVAFTTVLQFYRVIRLSQENRRRQMDLAKTKAELSEARIALLISQIQPHFLYNALNTIQYLCMTDAEKAADTVGKFAKYLRGNMDSLSLKEPIEFDAEISHLESYLAIEKLRFPDITFVYKFQTTKFKLPALTVQPLVENSIKYGVRGMEDGGIITIITEETPEAYVVIVKDNGKGFDINQKKNDGRSHVGMKNIASRVESMVGGTVTVESAIDQGTCTTIVIPKEDQNESNRS